MDLSFILAAAEHAAGAAEHAEEHHKSEAPFFIAGAIWVAFAIAVSVVGFKRPDFPGTAAIARGIMTAGTLMFVAALSTAIYVAI